VSVLPAKAMYIVHAASSIRGPTGRWRTRVKVVPSSCKTPHLESEKRCTMNSLASAHGRLVSMEATNADPTKGIITAEFWERRPDLHVGSSLHSTRTRLWRLRRYS